MSELLGDYNLWKSEIYDDSDEILFDEIVKCIDAKAYRAATIMVCISFPESLLNKLEILSESNKKITQDLANYREDGKDFLLIEYAKKYELINEIEHNHHLNHQLKFRLFHIYILQFNMSLKDLLIIHFYMQNH